MEVHNSQSRTLEVITCEGKPETTPKSSGCQDSPAGITGRLRPTVSICLQLRSSGLKTRAIAEYL